MQRNGGNSQDRRRQRRAAERRVQGMQARAAEETFDFDELVAAATGSTTLPLSERDRAWDASAADQRVREWAGATDAPNAKYARAFFWKASDGGDNFGDYKLGFADVVDGKLTAVFRGVTAVAAVLQGSRGGVDIPDADKSAIRGKVETYYSKAAKQYDDDTIRPPWADDGKENSASVETLLALAEVGADGLDVYYTDDGAIIGVGGSGEPMDAFLERVAYWQTEFGKEPTEVDIQALRAEIEELFGGEPSEGTKKDKRLKDNKTPEQAALEAFDETFQATVLCSCGHSYSEHSGATGACVHTDGRGTCSCAEFAEALVEAWSDGEGLTDVLADLNALLADSAPGHRAIDVSVKLDKAIVFDPDDESVWTAPMMITDNGAVGLSMRQQWSPLDESSRAAGTSARLQFALRDIVLTADGATAPPLPDEHQPGERVPKAGKKILPVQEPTPPAGASNDGVAWEATFVPEGVLTDDGRAFAPGSLTWRDLPLTLMAMINTSAEGGHDGALVSGRIDNIWREGNLIKASGMFDNGEYGSDIARMVGDGTLRGLSVDIAIHEAEVGPRSDYFNEDGTWREDAPVGQVEEQTVADMLFGGEDDSPPVFVVTKGVIGMATVCPFPAFADASIALIASGAGLRYTHQAGWIAVRRTLTAAAVAEEAPEEAEAETVDETTEGDGLTAAAIGAAPLKPPAEWFANPDLEELTPLTITDDGRIYGHAWSWESCHIAFPDSCVTAPHTATDNAYFHLGEIECEDGTLIPVGKVTIDAPHAGQRLSRADATAHYDHTGTVAAHVVCGEDEFGGWVSGAISPDLPEETLRLLRGSALSGDWRNVNGNLELVALLAVNVPGFPVPRVLVASAAEGEGMEVLSLVAAGVVRERTDEDELADIAELVKQVA